MTTNGRNGSDPQSERREPPDWLYPPGHMLRKRMPGWKTEAARTMRANPTPAEARLWEALRARQLGGIKFRRQVPMVGFIADFYCPALALVVEVDGGQHDPSYDAWRDTILAHYGLHVVRFSNGDVMHRLPLVVQQIRSAMFQRPFQHQVRQADPSGKEHSRRPDSASTAGLGDSAD